MEFYVSKESRSATVFLYVLGLGCLVGAIALTIYFASPCDIPWLFLPCGLFYAAIFCGLPLTEWKSLMIVRLEEGCFRSYFLGQMRSQVSTAQEVYYATFYELRKGPYILLSNQPLDIPKEGPFQIRMQQLGQVILPFNPETAPYLDLKHWHFHADIPLHYVKVSQLGRKHRS